MIYFDFRDKASACLPSESKSCQVTIKLENNYIDKCEECDEYIAYYHVLLCDDVDCGTVKVEFRNSDDFDGYAVWSWNPKKVGSNYFYNSTFIDYLSIMMNNIVHNLRGIIENE